VVHKFIIHICDNQVELRVKKLHRLFSGLCSVVYSSYSRRSLWLWQSGLWKQEMTGLWFVLQ